MKKRIINAPTPDTLAMLKRHIPEGFRSRLGLIRIDATGLLILPVPDFYFYADIASKSTNVVVSEIFGSCPQHITTLAIFSGVVAVHEAMQTIKEDDNQF